MTDIAIPEIWRAMGAERLTSPELTDDKVFLYSAGALFAWYLFGHMVLLNKGSRRRAWLITFFSSVVMTVCGSYFAYRLFSTNGDCVQFIGTCDCTKTQPFTHT